MDELRGDTKPKEASHLCLALQATLGGAGLDGSDESELALGWERKRLGLPPGAAKMNEVERRFT
jgi:hypothetical protein